MAKTRIWCFAFLLAFVALPGAAQENCYMVFFTDKAGITETLSKPIEFLSERAIARRLEQGIEITDRDLPVQSDYVDGIHSAGGEVLYKTRWMNGVLIHCTPSELSAVQGLPYVEHVEFVAPPGKDVSGGRRSFNLRRNSSHIGIETENQLQMLGIDRMHEANFKGEGVTIAVLDSGFPGVDGIPAFQHVVSEGRIMTDVSYDFVHDSPEIFQYDSHGTEVLSVIAGNIPDAFTGGAYEATFQLFVTEDVPTEYRVEEYNWLFAAEKADSAGADIIHSSLGYYDFDDPAMNYNLSQMDGKSTVISKAAQWAADRGIVVVASAGNEGSIPSWRIITAPADAVDVLAVGAVNSTGQKTGSSSIGPSSDNRIKPDLVALGQSVKVVKPTGQVSTASGTSLSAPLVTSLVAGVMQAYPELTSKEVVALLKQTASQGNRPDNLLGYGIPNFQAIVNFMEQDGTQSRPFEIYPNPMKADDTLTISPLDPEIFDSCEIEVVSSQGQVLVHQAVQFNWLNRTYKASLAGLAPGVYYIRVFSEKRKETFKLVKL
jgi:serine protease AprX